MKRILTLLLFTPFLLNAQMNLGKGTGFGNFGNGRAGFGAVYAPAAENPLVFEEPFSSEDSISANGGTFSGISLSNGIATFSADNSYVLFNTNPCHESEDLTIVARFKTSSAAATMILCELSINNTTNNAFVIYMASGLIYLADHDAIGYNKTHTIITNPYNDGEWHSLVAIIKRSVTVNPQNLIYIDGILDNIQSNEPERKDHSGAHGELPLYIGSRAGTSYEWDGDLDYFNIYNRALTVNEIGVLTAYDYKLGLQDTLINPYEDVIFATDIYIPTMIHNHNYDMDQSKYNAFADSGIVCFGYANYIRPTPSSPVWPDDYYGAAPSYPASRWGITLPIGTIEIPNSEQFGTFPDMVIPGSMFGSIGYNVSNFDNVGADKNPMVYVGAQGEGDTLSLNISDFIDSVTNRLLYENGGGIFMAHNGNFESITTYLDMDTMFLGMAIYNDWRGGGDIPTNGRGYYLDIWDSVLTSGRKCFGTGEQDYYNYGFIVTLSDDLTTEEVLKSIRKGEFYTKMRNTDLAFDSIVYIDDAVDSVKVYTTGATEINLVTENGQVATVEANYLGYELLANTTYIRAEAKKNGNPILISGYEDEIYSNAIMLKLKE